MKRCKEGSFPGNYRALSLAIIISLSSLVGISQTYNPSLFTVTNKSIGIAQAVPTDGRSMFWDNTNFVARDYASVNEVYSYLNLSKYRAGHFPVYIHLGGTLGGNGIWAGGITQVWFFKDSVANANLVRWYTDSIPSSGGLTQLIGDVLAGPGSGSQSATLAIVNANTGGFGNAANLVQLTLDAKGRVVAAANLPIQISESQVTNLTSDLASKLSNITGLIGSGSGYTLNGSGTSGSPYTLTITGSGSPCINCNADSIQTFRVDISNFRNGYALTIDTVNNKWVLAPKGTGVDSIWRTPGKDSIQFTINGVYHSILDSLGSAGSGLISLNGLTASTQIFATGTSGTDFNIVSTTATHTFNFPSSSASNRGLLTSTDWSTFNGKINLTSLSATSPLLYNNTTGVFSIQVANTSQSGYLSSTDWNTFNGKQGALTLTTTGSSGASTLIGNTLNIPNYAGGGGAVSSVTNSDGTLTISPTTGAVVASLALGHANTWSALQTFGALTTTGTTKFTGLTSAGANDSVATIDPATGTMHWRSGTFTINFLNGLNAPTTDSVKLGGALIQNTTIGTAGFSFSITGLPSKATALSTDSVNITDLLGKQWKLPVPAGGSLPTITNYSYRGKLAGGDTILQYSEINVLDIGLKADSVTDNTPILRAWLATNPTFSGRMHFPGVGKGYLFTDSVSLAQNLELYGDGPSSFPFYTIINVPHKGATNIYFNSPTANLFPLHSSAINKNPIIRIRDLTIKNTSSTTPTAGAAIVVNDGLAHSTFERLTLDSFYVDCQVNSGSFTFWENCTFLAPVSVGLYLANSGQPDGGGFIVSHCNIISGVRASSTAKGIYVQSGGGIDIHDNFFNAQQPLSNQTAQFLYPIYMDFAGGATSVIKVHDNHFENYQGIAIYMINRSGGSLYNVSVNFNEISPYTSPVHPGIYINSYIGVNLLGNYGVGFGSPSTETFIRIDSCTAIVSPGTIGTGWSSYDSSDVTSTVTNTMMDAYTNTVNGGWGNTIINQSTGTGSYAYTRWVAGSGTGAYALYSAPSLTPSTYAGSLRLSVPNGPVIMFPSTEAARFITNGNSLFGGVTVDSSAWVQVQANTATNASLWLKPSAGVGIGATHDGMLYYRGDSLVFMKGSTRVNLLASGGGSGVTTVGTFSGSSQTNGATISGTTITFGPADATNPGMVSTGAQTLAGTKTFTGQATFPAATTGAASLLITSSATVNPTSPTSGQLWWNGTNLNFYNGTTTKDLLIGSTPTLSSVLTAGNTAANNLLLTGYNSTSPNFTFGDFAGENFALNNVLLSDNVTVAAGVATKTHTGYDEGIQLFNGQGLGRASNTAAGGTTVTDNFTFKWDYAGNFAAGGNGANNLGSFSGYALIVNATDIKGNNSSNVNIMDLNFANQSLTVSSSSSSPTRGIISLQQSANGQPSFLAGQKSRGTIGAPAAILSGDSLEFMYPGGYDGATYQYPGFAGFVVDSTVSSGSVPGAFVVNTGYSASGTEKFRIYHTGAAKLNKYGLGTFTGTSAFHLAVDASGNIIEVSAGSGITTVGTFSGSSIANGASISGSTITFGPADGTNPGMVTTGLQTFAGAKTFSGVVTFNGQSTSAPAIHLNVTGSVPVSVGNGDIFYDGSRLWVYNGSFATELMEAVSRRTAGNLTLGGYSGNGAYIKYTYTSGGTSDVYTLPAVASTSQRFYIKNAGGAGSILTIAAAGGENLYTNQTVSSIALLNGQSCELFSDGVVWAVQNFSSGLSSPLVASNDLTGQTAAVSPVTSYSVPGSGSFNTFSVGGYLTVTAVSLDVIQLQVTYTDETSTSRTQSFFVQGATTGISATGANGYSPMNIRAKQGTSITVATVLTTGTGSITYDVGANITQLY